MPIHAIPFDFEEASKKFAHGKSPAFLRIETALNYYLNNPATWTNLKVLRRTIATWRESKAAPTIRDNAMQRLDAWIQGEIAGLRPWPDAEPLWGPGHNCYAYAMKCTQGLNLNNARPGRTAGNARNAQDQNFAQGVVDDAQHQGRGAWILRQDANAAPVPALLHGGYLVVMISIPMGYHFMRRNNLTGLWTHKNGGIRPEEMSWQDPDDHMLEDAIDDAAMLKVITDPRIVDGNWRFDAYLEIQNGGLVIS